MTKEGGGDEYQQQKAKEKLATATDNQQPTTYDHQRIEDQIRQPIGGGGRQLSSIWRFDLTNPKAIGTGNLSKIAHLMTRHLLHFKNQLKVCE